jgi:hypothetical protein
MMDFAKFLARLIVGSIFFCGVMAIAQPIGTNTAPNKVPVTTVANLPTCNAGNEGLVWGVSDQATAVAYNGAVTGSGATHQKVYCNGTAWVQQ